MNTARPKQIPPDSNWYVWLLLAGRGFGKTRVGCEQCWWWAIAEPGQRICVLAPTTGDLTKTIFEGESGFANIVPGAVLFGGSWSTAYNKSEHKLVFWNGSVIQGFPATEPERLRGPQFHKAWADELGAYHHTTISDAWDMLQFCLRLGRNPQIIVTTTPKPIPLIIELSKAKDTYITSGSSYENRANLADRYFENLVKYEGTTLGRQEIHAEIIDLAENSIYKRSQFKVWPGDREFPSFEFIVQSWDTAYTEKTAVSAKKEEADPSAFSVWGVFTNAENGRKEIMLIDCWDDYLAWDQLRSKALDYFTMTYGSEKDDTFSSLKHSMLTPKIIADPGVIEAKRIGKSVDAVVVEAVSGGKYLVQELNRAGAPVFAYNPGRADKIQRAHLVSHLAAQGMIWIPGSQINPGKFRDWAEKFLDQITAFPFVKHDDMVDTATQAWKFILDSGVLRVGDELWIEEEEAELLDEEFADKPSLTEGRSINPYAA